MVNEEMNVDNIELMAPAGSYDSLAAAIRNGANAVYFGIGKLNMRSRAADSFGLEDLKRITRICRWCGIRSYLTLNTVLFDSDMEEMRMVCQAARDAGISAIIASDITVVQHAHQIGLEVHMSVQANITNTESVKFYAQYADVIVLARELRIEQIQAICNIIKRDNICGPSGSPVRVELFVHGALCVAWSGRCYMSLAQYNTSANRGACFQPCRRKYRIIDEQTGEQLLIDNHYVMSPADLCMVMHLDRILDAGVTILKLEGRGRVADYTGTVTRVYREALDALERDEYTEGNKTRWLKELRSVFNRDFWLGGYYCGKAIEQWSASANSKAEVKRVHIANVSNYFTNISVAEFRLTQLVVEEGDILVFEGSTTGALRCNVSGIRVGGKVAEKGQRGDCVTMPVPGKVRRNDKVYKLVAVEQCGLSTPYIRRRDDNTL